MRAVRRHRRCRLFSLAKIGKQAGVHAQLTRREGSDEPVHCISGGLLLFVEEWKNVWATEKMSKLNSKMQDIALRLLAHEVATGDRSGTSTPGMVRVSEKLRRPISSLAGATGFRALLARALSLAKVQAPVLSSARVKPDGSLEVDGSDLPNGEAEEADTVLIAQLLGLLSNFIGEALTLRLVHDAWPSLPNLDGTSQDTQL